MNNRNKANLSIYDVPETYQRYLCEIYAISLPKKGGWVNNKEIAEKLNVKPASVSRSLYKLKQVDLIVWKPRSSIRLTENGKQLDKHLSESKAILEIFFKKVLKIKDIKLVKELSCEMEHYISKEVKIKFQEFLNDYLNQ